MVFSTYFLHMISSVQMEYPSYFQLVTELASSYYSNYYMASRVVA